SGLEGTGNASRARVRSPRRLSAAGGRASPVGRCHPQMERADPSPAPPATRQTGPFDSGVYSITPTLAKMPGMGLLPGEPHDCTPIIPCRLSRSANECAMFQRVVHVTPSGEVS